ncbi:hypothetical protein [Planomicrobium sp. YIM 101495]|uniref:hypothetical protein n=1 Tax=Planomicrobium sp. YIM 101495 TaxID=2665160 RepID=UPI0012B93E60|nr:hypothetical protein [Planomicrobium sp. YIM 101495]
MEKEREEVKEEEIVEEEEVVEEPKKEDRMAGIYSNVASNGYENLRTSHIENRAKKLRKSR